MQSVLAPLIGPKVCVPPSLKGRTALVTGGALGIGYEISRAFAKAGARVIMTNRKKEQGDEAIAKIQKENDGQADVEWVGCDLGDLKQVKEVFDGIAKKEDRLDILILSAGINTNQFGLDNDGIDRHFGVNWLGHYYAINRLYPLIRKTSKLPNTPAPRIVFESSEMHRFAPGVVHFASKEEINDSSVGPTELYGRTKLAMILGAKYGLVGKVIEPNHDNVYALSVHPGAVNTDMQDQWQSAYPGFTGKAIEAMTLFAGRSPEQGSYSAIYASCDEEVIDKGYNGYYLSDPATPGKETSQASDPKLGTALWELSERMVKEVVGEDALLPWTETSA